MFEPGDPVEVATVDAPEPVFDAAGTVVSVSLAQGAATVRLVAGEVEMFSFRRVRHPTDA